MAITRFAESGYRCTYAQPGVDSSLACQTSYNCRSRLQFVSAITIRIVFGQLTVQSDIKDEQEQAKRNDRN